MASMMSMIPEGLLLAFRARHSLVLENLALRHQIVVLQRSSKRPRLKMRDRVFWVLLSRIWSGWRESLSFVKPGRATGDRQSCAYQKPYPPCSFMRLARAAYTPASTPI
jgi:hypothetical protein